MRYRAHGRIDRELERVRQKPGDARHKSLPCLLASDIVVAVVRLPAEGMTMAFPLPIQFGEQNIREQRAQRPALRRALYPRKHQAETFVAMGVMASCLYPDPAQHKTVTAPLHQAAVPVWFPGVVLRRALHQWQIGL